MKGIKTISVVSKKVKKGYNERVMLSLCSSLCLSKKNLSNLSMRQCIPIIDLSLPFRDLSVWSVHIEIWAKGPGMVCEDGPYPRKRGWYPSSGYCKTGASDLEYPSNHSNHGKARINIFYGEIIFKVNASGQKNILTKLWVLWYYGY